MAKTAANDSTFLNNALDGTRKILYYYIRWFDSKLSFGGVAKSG